MKSLITPLVFALLAGPAFAQEKPDTEKRIADLEKKIAKLTKADEPKKEADGGYYIKFGGRVHLDATYFKGGQDKLPDGALLRRARISWKGGLGSNWVTEGDVDFAGGVSIKDLWAGYQGWNNTLVQVGHFKESFGMDTLTSSNNTWFLERSYTDTWTPDRHIGIGVSKWGERFHAKASFFGQSIDDTTDAQESADSNLDSTGLVKSYKIQDNQGWGAAARFVFLPLKVSDTKLIHVGVAGVQRTPNAAAPGVYAWDFSCRPEQNKTSRAKFLNASVTNVDKLVQTGVEFAGLWGPFSWQSEYQVSNVKRRNTQMLKWSGTALVATTAAEQAASTIDHKFSSYYGQVSWIFGGQRTYETGDGFFKAVRPSKQGALEVALRYSVMNQDDITTIDPVKGGKAKNMTLGLTYYVNTHLRFMLNHTKVDNNENAACSKAYSPTGVKIPGDDFGFTSLRMQINY